MKTVGKNAFLNCVKLKTVTGGAAIETIGVSAFSGCKALTKFTFNAKVKSIGKKAFFGCSSLKTMIFKTKLLKAGTVGANAFKGIPAKANVKVPAAQLKDYKIFLVKKGVSKTATIRK